MSNDKTQTGVEWYISKIRRLEFWVETKQITWKEYHKEKDKLLEQAKEMEKQRMIEFAQSYAVIHCMGDITKTQNNFTKKHTKMSNNKQQTAVEWLIEQFWNNEGMLTSKKLEKALEMEKEQTEQAKLDAKEIIIIKHTEHGGGEQ